MNECYNEVIHMKKTNYTVDYFIEKFEAIPAKLWCTDDYTKGKKHCALGHCGEAVLHVTKEGQALVGLFATCDSIPSVANTNDGKGTPASLKYVKAPTPKRRILHALRIIKENS